MTMTATTRRAMTPQDLTRIRFVSDPQLSPDGQRVAFVVTMLSAERDEYLANIWVVDTAGGPPRRFTTGPGRDTTPRWSPDGARLAFIAERQPRQKSQLHVMPADGGEPVRLTTLSNGVTEPVWSPDSARLAFVSRLGGWQEPDSEEEKHRSKPPRIITTMKYKFNNEGFTYDRRPHLFVVAADGGEPRQITTGDFVDGDPTWAPDGQFIAFVSARHAERDYDNAADVWVVAADGGEPRQVTDTAGPLSLPTFAPHGRQLAYLGHRYLHESGRNMRLFTVSVDGSQPVCLTEPLDRHCGAYFYRLGPLWSPDGAWLMFAVETEAILPYTACRPVVTPHRPASLVEHGRSPGFPRVGTAHFWRLPLPIRCRRQRSFCVMLTAVVSSSSPTSTVPGKPRWPCPSRSACGMNGLAISSIAGS
jgi:Tol biopolymer transport system component